MAAVGVAEALGRLAVALEPLPDVPAVLQRVVELAVAEVPGADLAGITVVDPQSGAHSPATSDPLVADLEDLQYERGDGPCLEAATTQQVVHSGDLASERRWPQFAAHATGCGVASVLSVQMFVEAGAVGSLNLYALRAAAFTPDSEALAVPLAMHAAVAMTNTRKQANLRLALASRDVIGQAKGVLMERHRIDADQAYALLVAASQRSARKLRAVAEGVAATGELALPAAEVRRSLRRDG